MPLGIPHSKFLSWSEDDQDKALAYLRREAERCSGCGIHPSDVGDDPDAFVGNITYCQWCERTEQESHNIPEDRRNSRAYRVGLLPRDVALRLMAAQDGAS